ncbi:MAG: GTPase HflX [Bacteroidetes bacterium]|nr:GTPase HflX [Bacteroidota bacterium]
MNDFSLTIKEKEKVILVGVFGPDLSREQAQEHLDELERLTDTAGAIAVKKILQNRTNLDREFYVGKGKIEEISLLITLLGADSIIFDDDLTPSQARNIQRITQAKIIDRSGLILDIFASRAKTSSAKTQVELAQLNYILPRLTRAWTHLSRQKGGIGTKGPGETQIETDRRLIGQRIAVLKEKLKKLDLQRLVQRKGRADISRVAIVGYTNAGKSSLLNQLTTDSVLAEDRLFATLDSTVRRHLIGNKTILLSDTVGFIRKLPHGLIESFKSTLDEIRESDLLLHVVDVSSPTLEDYIKVVRKTLEEIKADEKPTILVFNKTDLLKDPFRLAELKINYPNAVFISAQQQIGFDVLEKAILEHMESDYETVTLRIPQKAYKIAAFVHQAGTVLNTKYVDDSVLIKVNLKKSDILSAERELTEFETETRTAFEEYEFK